MRSSVFVIVAILLLAATAALGAISGASAADPSPQAAPALSPDSVLASLNASIDWYRQARVTMREVNRTGAVFAAEDQETARQALQRAFAAARARAALLRLTPDAVAPKPTPGQERLAQARTGLETAIKAEEQWVARAPKAEREAARRRLELERARLDIMKQMQSFSASLSGGAPADLTQQIDMLEQSVPELKTAVTTSEPVSSATTADSGSRTLTLVSQLIRLRQSRVSVDDLSAATATLSRSVTAETRAVGDELRSLGTRLSTLAENPDAAAPDQGDAEFHMGLARAKALAAVVVPLREETSLLRRYVDDLRGWTRALDTETRDVLKTLGVELLRVAIVIGLILVGAVVWRFLTLRYIADASRRRLLLTARTIVITMAIVLVIVFHFASELTALVTALGFAAAGIAFALQNVILALAGYFAMLSPNGIRVGDRVSLQGPFAYVNGEVLDIGFVRIRLRELAGDPPKPTGRIVVFPNSVVFTGTFFKHPTGEDAGPLRRSA
jgi:Mechanosensitive ion channel